MNQTAWNTLTWGLCACAVAVAIGCGTPGAAAQEPGQAGPFSFDRLTAEAKMLAAQPPAELDTALPPPLDQLDYRQWREIEFVPDRTLFRAEHLPFEAQFYHRGDGQRQHVSVSLVDPLSGAVRPVAYDPAMFNFRHAPHPDASQLTPQLGFAGLKILASLNRPADMPFDELISFLGASYFRALAPGQVYGTSIRGIAVDTGLTDMPEQFPVFTHFYLVHPRAGDRQVVIYALLQGKALTGAYRFTIEPGAATRVEVETRLFFRDACRVLGLAPLTSMFETGENDPHNRGDYRPEIHDADGLLVRDASGDLWRPLHNPDHLTVTDIPVDHLTGFGLLQRDRDFDHYQDVEAEYQHRPSVWVRFDHPPGDGMVRLVELPTDTEYADNVTAFWLPHKVPGEGNTLTLNYTLLLTSEPSPDRSLNQAGAIVTTTRFDRLDDHHRLVLLDFAGPQLPPTQKDADPGDLQLHFVNDAAVQHNTITLLPVPDLDVWRLTFIMVGPPGAQSPLRVQLARGGRPIGEAWLDPGEALP